jgi:hypothetical protein
MAYYVDNPAGRLHKLLLDLHALSPNEQKQKTKQGWSAIVDLVGNEAGLAGEAAIVSGVVALPAQIRVAVGALQEDDERKEHLLVGLDKIEQGMHALVQRQTLHNVFLPFATQGVVPESAAVNSLSYCSYELHKAMPEVTVSEDDLRRIAEMVNDLMAEVAEADLPLKVKRAMLNHLVALLQAVHNVRFAGTQPMDDALFALTGSVRRTATQEDVENNAGFWEKFKKFLSAANLLFSTGQTAAQLGQGVAELLDR